MNSHIKLVVTGRNCSREKPVHPSEPVPVTEQLCLNPTNIPILWLSQDLYFAKYWAQLACNKPIGLAQRMLFSFSSKIKAKCEME